MHTPSVTLLGTWPPTPGISAYCYELAAALSRVVTLDVLTFRKLYPDFLYPGGPVPKDDTFSPTPETIRQVREKLTWYNPMGWILAGLRTKSDVLHVQFWSLPPVPILATIMLLFRLRRGRCILTVHNLAEHERRRFFGIALRSLLRLSDAVITHQANPPEWFRGTCLRATRRQPVFVPHGPLNLFTSGHSTRTEARSAMNIPNDARVLLFFGAIRPYKGLDVLLDAFDIVAARLPGAYLVVAGRAWESFDRYQQMIDRAPWKDRVRLRIDYIPTGEVARYFDAADLVVLPYHRFEAQSGVAMAAAGFGKPMIVTNVGALPTLQPDSDLVVSPGDPAAIAKAILSALDSPDRLAQLEQTARQVAQSHSWDEIAARTLDVYRSVLCCPPLVL